MENFENLEKHINNQAIVQNPNIATGSKIIMVAYPIPGGGIRKRAKTDTTYEVLADPNTLQARVRNEVYTEKENSNKYYIPVEFWGSANPDLDARHVKENDRYKDFAEYFEK